LTSDGTEFKRPGTNPGQEEMPVTAAVYIDALGAAYRDGGKEDLIHSIRSAADWFLGANQLGQPLYDFATGGCHDAITAAEINRNQGTEASSWCLLSFLTLHRLASVELSVDPETAA
jgi:hypothetical protein